MCGNATRCIGKYVYERGLTNKTEVRLMTGAGIKILNLRTDQGKVTSIRVDMGIPEIQGIGETVEAGQYGKPPRGDLHGGHREV